jgi:hypothetical protein
VTASLKNKAERDLAVAARKLASKSSGAPAHIGLMMCLRSSAQPGDSAKTVSIVRPVETEAGPGPTTRNAAKKPKTLGGSSSASRKSYKWEETPRIIVFGAGLNEGLYPAIGKCAGKQNMQTSQIVELLNQLLDCIPQVSVPAGSHDNYQRHLMPIR